MAEILVPARASLRFDLRHVSAVAWERIALATVVALSTLLYVWDLSINGYANTYYSAAALAAGQSWKAWFFGAFDAGSFITVDKPPLSTMLMGFSVRLLGLSPWAILLPQALAGVATVVILFYAVRRSFGAIAAFIAAVVMALTPVAVLMFRFNNPDALLTLLCVGAAAALLRALERGAIRWAVAAGVLVGCAFLAKYLQAYLVLPALALVWTLEARTTLRRRLVGLVAAAAAVLVSSGWWVAVVDLLSASERPYIGGSANNSALELLLGYDGLQRIFGFLGSRGVTSPSADGGFLDIAPLGGGGFGGPGFGGTPGLGRLFEGQFVTQVSWLLPFALIALVIGLALHTRAPRGDSARAGYLLWGGWLLVAAGVFSLMSGIIHPYYTVQLAPAIAALVGAGVVELWRMRGNPLVGRVALALVFFASAAWEWRLLALTPSFVPWLGPLATALAAIVSLVLVIAASMRRRAIATGAAAIALGVVLSGPAAYAVATVSTPAQGAIPAAGPSEAFGTGGGFGGAPAQRGARPNAGAFPGGPAYGAQPSGPTPPNGVTPPSNFPGGAPGRAGVASAVPTALTDYLLAHKGNATWIVAVSGAQEAGSIELATREPVMAMGGFMGSDPAPTLAQLQEYVRTGQLRYVLIGGAGFGPGGGGRGGASSIASWVQANGTPVDLGVSFGTLYDLAVK